MKNNQYEAQVAYSDALCGYDQPGRQEAIVIHQGAMDDIDSRVQEEITWSQPIEQLIEVWVDEDEPTKVLKIGSVLTPTLRIEVDGFLKRNLDIFVWTHADMKGIDAKVMCHTLNADPLHSPKRQKHWPMNPERYEALKEEVDKLISNGFIREAHYPSWVSNLILVIKPNGTWRTCVDFSDLNKACSKDGFPLPRIDQMVDATAGHEMLSFMNAYSGYNQIHMHPSDEEHTSFITDRSLYCYKANPEKIQAMQDMKSPTRPKEVQRLTGCVAALNMFILKATDKCVLFFDALKGSNNFEWTPRCEEAFQKLKEHLGMPPILSKPIPGERLSLYLSVSDHAVSSVLIRNEERV
ncbi:hypothetical protein L484_001142 [Morus notabilis]|uniref:Uncharacterized protein n=1 Tax=Morus notabilis TaxID=981085 RepID=W9QHE8_9ROSA|nr:hypothetical protein L484_001142 [Morus notabilis]